MYIKNNIAYAGDAPQLLSVAEIRVMDFYKLWLRFSNGDIRRFDFSALLCAPAFAPLRDEALFKTVVLGHGVPTWDGGNIDIAPEYLYENGVEVFE